MACRNLLWGLFVLAAKKVLVLLQIFYGHLLQHLFTGFCSKGFSKSDDVLKLGLWLFGPLTKSRAVTFKCVALNQKLGRDVVKPL